VESCSLGGKKLCGARLATLSFSDGEWESFKINFAKRCREEQSRTCFTFDPKEEKL
jgi:hypothetical protein